VHVFCIGAVFKHSNSNIRIFMSIRTFSLLLCTSIRIFVDEVAVILIILDVGQLISFWLCRYYLLSDDNITGRFTELPACPAADALLVQLRRWRPTAQPIQRRVADRRRQWPATPEKVQLPVPVAVMKARAECGAAAARDAAASSSLLRQAEQ
jgi:hypothetical protein